MAVMDAAEAFSRLATPRISCDPARCVKVRHRKASCSACMDVCPSGAIEVADNAIAFHDERCLNCGACACACPTQALETTQPSAQQVAESLDQALALAQIADGTLFVACEQAGQPLRSSGSGAAGSAESANRGTKADHRHRTPFDTEESSPRNASFVANHFNAVGVTLPCLAHLDESLLVHALACGFSRIILVDGGCATCPRAQGDTIEAVCDQARRWLNEWLDDPNAHDESARRLERIDSTNAEARAALLRSLQDFADQLQATLGPGWRSVALDADVDMISRRGLLSSFVDHTMLSVAQAAAQTLDAGAASQQNEPTLAQRLTAGNRLKTFSVPRAELMLDTLYARQGKTLEGSQEQGQEPPSVESEQAPSQAHGSARFANRIFGTPRVSQACDCCGICVTFCPTCALTGTPARHRSAMTAPRQATDATSAMGESADGTLLFRPNDCVSCGLCEDVCPRKAIKLTHGTDPTRLFELEPRLLRGQAG